jgi:hypothetical protein
MPTATDIPMRATSTAIHARSGKKYEIDRR